MQMLGRPEAAAVLTRRDLALWLWKAHNEVRRPGAPTPRGALCSVPQSHTARAPLARCGAFARGSASTGPLNTAARGPRLVACGHLGPRQTHARARCRAPPQVNGRLARLEAEHGRSSTGDPLYPKRQWPRAVACAACRTEAPAGEAKPAAAATPGETPGDGTVWNKVEIRKYLLRSYAGPAPDAGASLPWDMRGSSVHVYVWVGLAVVSVLLAYCSLVRRVRRHGPHKVL